MAKKLFAVTNVKIGSGPDEFFPAGTVVDHTKLSKSQLQELHDQGAVEIRTVDSEDESAPEGTEDTSDRDSEGNPVKEDVNPGPGTEPVE